MIKERIRTRIPAISATVGLLWVFSLAVDGLNNPLISLCLVLAVAIAAIARPRVEIVGVALAATLALATITATPESFAVAGGSFVTCLGAMAISERRFRLSVFGFAAASVAVLAIAAPIVAEDNSLDEPSLESLASAQPNASEPELDPLVALEIEALQQDLQQLEPVRVNPNSASDLEAVRLVDDLFQLSESNERGRPLVTEPDPGDDNLWLQLIFGAVIFWLIRKSLVSLPAGPDHDGELSAVNDAYVERLESAGERLGITRNKNESILAYGDRLANGLEDEDLSTAGAMISEHLYGKPESVDTDELQRLLDRLDTRTPPGGQPT